MWLEGRFCAVAYLVCRFSSGVSQQKGALALPRRSRKKIWVRTRAHLRGQNCQKCSIRVHHAASLRKRFHSTCMPYTWRVVARLESGDAASIYSFEKHMHRQLAKFRYRPQVAFGGHMECYRSVEPILGLLPMEAVVESEWIEKKAVISSSFKQLNLFTSLPLNKVIMRL